MEGRVPSFLKVDFPGTRYNLASQALTTPPSSYSGTLVSQLVAIVVGHLFVSVSYVPLI